MMDLRTSICRYIGQTVTIFTESGGFSGCGFTGTLAAVDDCVVRLITALGDAPACPVGNGCFGFGCPTPPFNSFNGIGCNNDCCSNDFCNNDFFNNGFGNFGGFNGGCFNGFNNFGFGTPWGNPFTSGLGAVTEIPIDKIVSFTHCSI